MKRSAGSIEALVRRNAERCESAKSHTCECRCGGALHGVAHSAEWVKATADAVLLNLAQRDQEQGELDLRT